MDQNSCATGEQFGSRLAAKHDAVQQSLIVFQGEIRVASGRNPEIGNLTLHQHVGQ